MIERREREREREGERDVELEKKWRKESFVRRGEPLSEDFRG